MTKTKSSAKKVSSASKRTQNAWKTRNKIAAEKDQRLKDLESKNLAFQSEIKDLRDKLNRPNLNSMEIPQPVTAESLRIDLNKLKLEKERSLNDFTQKIAAKEAEIGDFIKKRKAEIETLS